MKIIRWKVIYFSNYDRQFLINNNNVTFVLVFLLILIKTVLRKKELSLRFRRGDPGLYGNALKKKKYETYIVCYANFSFCSFEIEFLQEVMDITTSTRVPIHDAYLLYTK